MILIVGLGNPGAQYAGHRHNVGFVAVDAIAERWGFQPERAKFQGIARDGRLGGDKALILKPMTYMNESGRAVGEALRFFKLAPEDVVVFHDEIDLAPGKLRVKAGGGHAGHNGLRSIEAHIGPAYRRIRIGVGHPGHKDRVAGYVLHDFSKADQDWLDPSLTAMADAAPRLQDGDDKGFQAKVAAALQPARPKADKKPAPAAQKTDAPKEELSSPQSPLDALLARFGKGR